MVGEWRETKRKFTEEPKTEKSCMSKNFFARDFN
jgi:hypothetical protein